MASRFRSFGRKWLQDFIVSVQSTALQREVLLWPCLLETAKLLGLSPFVSTSTYINNYSIIFVLLMF